MNYLFKALAPKSQIGRFTNFEFEVDQLYYLGSPFNPYYEWGKAHRGAQGIAERIDKVLLSKLHRFVVLKRVATKGFNFVRLTNGSNVFKKHLYDTRYRNKEVPEDIECLCTAFFHQHYANARYPHVYKLYEEVIQDNKEPVFGELIKQMSLQEFYYLITNKLGVSEDVITPWTTKTVFPNGKPNRKIPGTNIPDANSLCSACL